MAVRFSNANANSPVKEVRVQRSVIRCGCDDPLSHATLQLPCPTPRGEEPLPTIYYYRNPLKRFVMGIVHTLGGTRH